MGKNETEATDRLLAAAVRKHPNLRVYANSGYEHCIHHKDIRGKGSLWVSPQRNRYRLQTTGMAQALDPTIERELGQAAGSQKINEYKFWYTSDGAAVERLIDAFARI